MKIVTKWLWIIASVCIGLAGVYCIMNPAAALLTLAIFVGWMMLFGGFLHFVRYWMIPKELRSGWFLVGATIDILLGGYVLSANRFVGFAGLLALFFAAYMVVRGVITVLRFCQKEMRDVPHRGIYILIGIATAAIGVGLFMMPEAAVMAIGWLLGIGLLMSGLSSFVLLME